MQGGPPMSEHKLTPLQIQAFARHLLLEEKSAATMEKYLRDILLAG